MAFVPFGDGVVEAVIGFTKNGVPGVMTQGYKLFTGPATPIDGLNLATLISNWLAIEVQPHTTSDTLWNTVTVNDLTSVSGWQATFAGPGAGTDTGLHVTNQVAMCVTFETAKRGRSFRGRNYVPGLPQTNLLDSTHWNSSAVTFWAGVYDSLELTVSAGSWTPVVLSRFAGGAPRTLGVATPIANYRANAYITTQRRRLV